MVSTENTSQIDATASAKPTEAFSQLWKVSASDGLQISTLDGGIVAIDSMGEPGVDNETIK